jgi:hypothetical protein
MKFEGGRNIAMKVPPHLWEQTVGFYRDTAGLEVIKEQSTEIESVCFRFGANQLWIDKVPTLSQSELWLELKVEDSSTAEEYLATSDTTRCDEIEPLPPDFRGFWIQSPAGIVHIVSEKGEEE